MTIQEHVSLKELTTFKIGGSARYLVVAQSTAEIWEALSWAREKKCPYFILGGGSNLIFSDSGFNGLVIKPLFTQIAFKRHTVSAGASVVLADCIDATLKHGLVGMEFAAGIPGSVGGAVRGNAGTYGVAMSDVLSTITFIAEDTHAEHTIATTEAEFSYRHSMFKNHGHLITSVEIGLTTGDVEESRRLIEERIRIRHENHPLEPSAGCIFKNVEFGKTDTGRLAAQGLALEKFKQYQKIPSGFLIESLGLKGKTIGGAQISPRHGNYIINTGAATFEDVITLIRYIKQQVRDAYGIQLEEEVHIVL